MTRQIPNIFTLLNLFFGCMAIIACMQSALTILPDAGGQQVIEIPERIYWASIYIGVAALIDFLDGFLARALKASSELGKQLDSLADVVSFGVAPGMIIYQFLRVSYAQQPDGLDIPMIWLLPAFVVPCAAAYRLGRFNIDPSQATEFKGLPVPAAGLLIASFPLIYWFSNMPGVIALLRNNWFWYGIVLLTSYLMVSTLPMMALKFSGMTRKKTIFFGIIAITAIAGGILFQWLAVPAAFAMYIILSLIYKSSPAS